MSQELDLDDRLLSQRLRVVREGTLIDGKRITQSHLAQRIGVSPWVISRIERGRIKPPARVEFYDRLTDVVGENNTRYILDAPDAPWKPFEQPTVVVRSHKGNIIRLYADPTRQYTPDELELMKSVLRSVPVDVINRRDTQLPDL